MTAADMTAAVSNPVSHHGDSHRLADAIPHATAAQPVSSLTAIAENSTYHAALLQPQLLLQPPVSAAVVVDDQPPPLLHSKVDTASFRDLPHVVHAHEQKAIKAEVW